MVEIVYTEKFKKEVEKTDKSVRDKISTQIEKIINNPEIGKPLRYNLKGERTVYVKPFRIIYAFVNVREIKLHPLGCRSCFATSDFSEHPEVPNKPHTLVCGKTQGLLDNIIYFLRFEHRKEVY